MPTPSDVSRIGDFWIEPRSEQTMPPYGALTDQYNWRVYNLQIQPFNHFIMITSRILEHFINSDLGLIRHAQLLLYSLILYTMRMVAEGDRNM